MMPTDSETCRVSAAGIAGKEEHLRPATTLTAVWKQKRRKCLPAQPERSATSARLLQLEPTAFSPKLAKAYHEPLVPRPRISSSFGQVLKENRPPGVPGGGKAAAPGGQPSDTSNALRISKDLCAALGG